MNLNDKIFITASFSYILLWFIDSNFLLFPYTTEADPSPSIAKIITFI